MTLITAKIGTFDETPNGKVFREISSGKFDSLSQVEAEIRRIGGRPEEYDITDMDGELLKGLTVKINTRQHFVSF